MVVDCEERSDEEMAALLASASVHVLLTRGEGWGLPLVQSMALGIPVISTNWSGATAFLNADNGFPVDYKLVPSTQQHGRCAQPSTAHARKLMRYVFTHPEAVRRKGARAREAVRRFDRAAVGAIMAGQLDRIAQGMHVPPGGGGSGGTSPLAARGGAGAAAVKPAAVSLVFLLTEGAVGPLELLETELKAAELPVRITAVWLPGTSTSSSASDPPAAASPAELRRLCAAVRASPCALERRARSAPELGRLLKKVTGG